LINFQTKLTETKGGEQHEPKITVAPQTGPTEAEGAHERQPPVVEVNESLALSKKSKKGV